MKKDRRAYQKAWWRKKHAGVQRKKHPGVKGDMPMPETLPDELLRALVDNHIPWRIEMKGIVIGDKLYRPKTSQNKWKQVAAEMREAK